MSFTKFLERLVDAISFSKIVLSPTLIGIFFGIVCYANKPDRVGLLLSIGISVIGFIAGVALAMWASKNGGATEFTSRVNASPDISEAVKNDKELEK